MKEANELHYGKLRFQLGFKMLMVTDISWRSNYNFITYTIFVIVMFIFIF